VGNVCVVAGADTAFIFFDQCSALKFHRVSGNILSIDLLHCRTFNRMFFSVCDTFTVNKFEDRTDWTRDSHRTNRQTDGQTDVLSQSVKRYCCLAGL